MSRDTSSRTITAAFALALLAGAAPGAVQPFFSGTGILGPDPSGDFTASRIFALSADGAVAAGTSTSADGNRAVRWSLSSGLEALPTLTGAAPADTASAVAAGGAMIFGASTSLTSGVGEATRWDTGGATGLGYLDPSDFAQSNIVDATPDGSTLVGLSSNVGVLDFEATRWVNGVPTSLGQGSGSSATAVSNDGASIAGSRAGTNGAFLGAFLWTPSGVTELLDLASGGFFDTGATALDISADGSRIVGWATETFAQRPVMWDTAGTPTDLGVPFGFDSGLANAISDDGSIIVGGASGFMGETAFIWTQPTGSIALADYLSPHIGGALAGWTLLSADAISADGLTFAGVGLDPLGNTQGWVAHIPSPVTLAPLALAAAPLSARRRRPARGSARTR